MLFFCPIDAPRSPLTTTLAEQQALILTGDRNGQRERHGLAVDATSARAASLTLEAYLIDCHRSGRPGYTPSVTIEDREGVPVATLIEAPDLKPDDIAALETMVEAAKRRVAAPKQASEGSTKGWSHVAAEKHDEPTPMTVDNECSSAPV